MNRSMRSFRALLMVSALTAVSACASQQYHDADAKLKRDDFRTLNKPPAAAQAPAAAPQAAAPAIPQPLPVAAKAPPVPQLYPVLATPQPPAILPNRSVSLSVTEDVPLKDVLFELARQAEVDIEIDPRIEGGIVFSARNRPLMTVIDRISKLAGLRYTAADNTIRIELDEAYLVKYDLPFLSLVRNTQGTIGINTQVVSPGGTGGTGGDTASKVQVSTESLADFFGELDASLKGILANTNPRGLKDQGEKASPVLMNRQTGIVTVFGNSAQQEAVKTYLDALRQAASTQVLIEAKVVEVALSEQYNAGINWQTVFSKAGVGVLGGGVNFGVGPLLDLGATLNDAQRRQAVQNAAASTSLQNRANFAFGGGDLSAVVSLVEGFGTTRTLSSPRITVMNNQTAIMKVAENEVFFEVRAEREENSEDPSRSRLNVDSTIRTIPIGLVMAVHPSINAQADRVTLTLRPTITRVTRFASDPAPRLISNGTIESNIPVVEVREVDSVLQLQSGEVAVLGGLMQERARNNDNGLPGISKVPVVGNAFKQREENSQLTELVIFLKAEIIRAPRIAPADVRLYQNFTKDPRPLSF